MSSDRIKDQDGKDKTATTNQAIKSSKASQIAIWLLLGGAIVIAALVLPLGSSAAKGSLTMWGIH